MVFGNATKPSSFAHSWQSAQSLTPATRNDIWTSKSAANMWYFVHFHFDMCFAPQRRALFPHRNFQKWREHVVFCTFSLRNVLRATTACTFSTSQLPKVVRTWCALHILTCKCASCHNGVHFFDISTAKSGPRMVCFVHFDLQMCFAPNGVQFFISHLASWLRTCRFSEPTFRPSGAPNHWKNSVSRLSYLFSHLHLLSSYSFSSTLLSSNLSLLSASSLLCFSSVHIVGSLTSKLPSTIKPVTSAHWKKGASLSAALSSQKLPSPQWCFQWSHQRWSCTSWQCQLRQQPECSQWCHRQCHRWRYGGNASVGCQTSSALILEGPNVQAAHGSAIQMAQFHWVRVEL